MSPPANGEYVLSGEVQVLFEPVPDWVDESPIPPDVAGVEQVGGRLWLLADLQISLLGSAAHRFQRHLSHLSRVVDAQGLEHSASLNIVFDPHSHRVVLHRLLVHRGLETIDQSSVARISTMRRERQLERQVVDGRLTVAVQLSDIRVDDIVETSFSLIGDSPALAGRFADTFFLNAQVPVAQMRRRLIAPKARNVATREFGHTGKPQITEHDGIVDMRWYVADSQRATIEVDMPKWFNAFDAVQLSEFSTWSVVVALFLTAYEPPQALPATLLQEFVASSGASATPKERAAAALRFVQDKVRYLALAFGSGGYYPRPVADIWAGRFGDCKDLSVLLVGLLRHAGLEAAPALVSKALGRGIASLQPTPNAFDHCIVKLTIGEQIYWLDPTRSTQRGDLDHIYQHDFGVALPLSPSTRELERLVFAERKFFDVECKQDLNLSAGFNKPAKLKLRRTFRSYAAEFMRAQLSNLSRADYQRSRTDILARHWPKIAVDGEFGIQDDDKNNEVVIEENYDIPEPWRKVSDKGSLFRVEVMPMEVFAGMRLLSEQARKTPRALPYPHRASEIIDVSLRKTIRVKTRVRRVANAAFKFVDDLSYDSGRRRIRRQMTMESLRDHVMPGEYAQYQSDVRDVVQSPALRIPHRKRWPRILGAVIAIGPLLILWGCAIVSSILRSPPP